MMYHSWGYGMWASQMQFAYWLQTPTGKLTLALFVIWTIFWKGLALWHSAKRGQGWWFLVLLLVNSVGILEIVYLFFILNLHINELFPWRKRS